MRLGSLSPALAIWGAFLAVLTGVMAFFTVTDPEPPVLLGGAAALVVVVAGVVTALRVGTPDPGTVASPQRSLATVWLGVSIALLALSAALGFWLTLIAAGMTGAGLGALVREVRGEARA